MTQKLISIVTVFAVIAATPMALADDIIQEKYKKIDSIDEALDKARQRERSIFGVQQAKADGKKKLTDVEKNITRIMREKRNVRLQLSRKRELADVFRAHYGVDPEDSEQLQMVLEEQKAQLEQYIKKYVRMLALRESKSNQFGQSILSRLAGNSLGDSIEEDLRYRAIARSREKMYSLAVEVQGLPEAIAELTTEHERLLDSYHGAADEHDTAKDQIALSDSQLREIQQIVKEVELQVTMMQAELARYDERLRMEAERDLIALGLRSEAKTTAPRKPTFIWPLDPPITVTAGFMNKAYKSYFGVAHKATDIRAKQGTPVKASANGIVYLVRDGGKYGYSYILIGHRSGYATLYGHMNKMYVRKGQEVSQGDIIGLSGGQPGSYGAGPMTTGPHLHFEVILNGVHINATSVLPAI